MKQLSPLVLLLFCLVSINGCTTPGTSNGPQNTGTAAPEDKNRSAGSPADTIAISGTIVFVNLEGGFFAIRDDDDGRTYNPINLPEAFKKDGLSVGVLARPKVDVMSIHMAGPMIEIVHISAR